MLKSNARLIASLMMIVLLSLPAAAQQGGDDGGDTGTGGTNQGLGGGSFTELDREAAFEAVERGDTIGASENTGAGFGLQDEDSGGGAGGGAGGIGGLGGLGGGFGGLGGLGGFGNLFGGQATGTQTAKPIIRTRMRSAVDVAPRLPQDRQRIAAERFRRLPSSSPLRGLNVSVEGRTAVVTGVVQSERHRRMSELLLRLEPGIRDVDNRVTVAQ